MYLNEPTRYTSLSLKGVFALVGGVVFWSLMCAIVVFMVFDRPGALRTTGFAAGITLWLVGVWILLRARTRRAHLFEPAITGGLMLALLFGIRPLAMIFSGDTEYYRWIYIGDVFPEAVLLGAVATLVFIASYEIGVRHYVDRWGRINAVPGCEPSQNNWQLLYFYTAALFSTSVALFLVQLHFYGGISEALPKLFAGQHDQLTESAVVRSAYLSLAPILSACGAALLIIGKKGYFGKLRTILFVSLLIGFPLIVFFVAGERRFMIPSLGIPVVAYYLIRRRQVPARLVFVVAPVALVIAMSVPYLRNEQGRQEVGGITGFPAFLIEHPQKPAKLLLLRSETEMVPVLATEIRTLKEQGNYYYGAATFGDLLLAPIPHSIFPDKPETARNRMLIRIFGSPCKGRSGGICPDFSAVGTFYQDGGWLGVLLGMSLIGWISGRLWRAQFSALDRSMVTGIVACWTVLLPIVIRAGFMPGLQWILYFLVPILGGLLLFRLPRRMPMVSDSAGE